MATSRELVYQTLDFKGPERVPRQLWELPWAAIYYPEGLKKIKRDFPDDIVVAKGFCKQPPKTYGNCYEIGEYVDEWGCKFINRQQGVIGEVKKPLIKGENWENREVLRIPEELLYIDTDKVNEFCKNTDKFVI